MAVIPTRRRVKARTSRAMKLAVQRSERLFAVLIDDFENRVELRRLALVSFARLRRADEKKDGKARHLPDRCRNSDCQFSSVSRSIRYVLIIHCHGGVVIMLFVDISKPAEQPLADDADGKEGERDPDIAVLALAQPVHDTAPPASRVLNSFRLPVFRRKFGWKGKAPASLS